MEVILKKNINFDKLQIAEIKF